MWYYKGNKDFTTKKDGLFGVGATDDNPCDLFERIDFPVDEFFPPERGEFLECDQDDISEPEDDSDCDCRR